MIVDDLAKVTRDLGLEGTREVPFVFWDGYGLDRHASGVFVHAKKMSQALQTVGVDPFLLGNLKSASLLKDMRTFVVPQAPLGGRKITESKLIWPERAGRFLEKLIELGQLKETVILHGLSNLNLPLLGVDRTRIRTVLTIHDVIPFLTPDGVSKSYYWQFKTALPRVVRLAERIVCVSDWTRRTLLDFYPEIADKTVVIRNGVDPDWPQKIRQRTKPNGPLQLICNTRFEVYKDINLLFEIVRKHPDQLNLTLITNDRGLDFAGRSALDLLKSRHLTVLTNVGLEELDRLYERAHVLVHPSRFEGYCLPAAEALATGLPVVYIAGSGIDEVVGDKVGIPMDAQATASDWAEAIFAAADRALSPDFLTILTDHLVNLTTWKDAATALKSVYTGLRRS